MRAPERPLRKRSGGERLRTLEKTEVRDAAQSLDAAKGLFSSGDDGTDRAWEDIKSI